MMSEKILTAVGLMSGTSLDGVDVALIDTDGAGMVKAGPGLGIPYDPSFREQLHGCLGKTADHPGVADIARELTLRNAAAVNRLLDENGLTPSDIDVIGFHGQTILHRPDQRLTVQIGDGALLARETGCPVVSDFRTADVAAGGQGAPFAPLYHAALAEGLEKPLAVLNIGGVGNVTYIGGALETQLLAFDTGPGNALLDDWCAANIGQAMDEGGRLARGGTVDQAHLAALLENDYFALKPPKSLDREDFSNATLSGMAAADGAATLAALSVAAIVRAQDHFPAPVLRWLVTGGGRKNGFLMEKLAHGLAVPVDPVEAVGWDGDLLEAQAFAYLAVRSLSGMATSLPTTTGVPEPICGGVLFKL